MCFIYIWLIRQCLHGRSTSRVWDIKKWLPIGYTFIAPNGRWLVEPRTVLHYPSRMLSSFLPNGIGSVLIHMAVVCFPFSPFLNESFSFLLPPLYIGSRQSFCLEVTRLQETSSGHDKESCIKLRYHRLWVGCSNLWGVGSGFYLWQEDNWIAGGPDCHG